MTLRTQWTAIRSARSPAQTQNWSNPRTDQMFVVAFALPPRPKPLTTQQNTHELNLRVCFCVPPPPWQQLLHSAALSPARMQSLKVAHLKRRAEDELKRGNYGHAADRCGLYSSILLLLLLLLLPRSPPSSPTQPKPTASLLQVLRSNPGPPATSDPTPNSARGTPPTTAASNSSNPRAARAAVKPQPGPAESRQGSSSR
jgi:hypothetical protein